MAHMPERKENPHGEQLMDKLSSCDETAYWGEQHHKQVGMHA